MANYTPKTLVLSKDGNTYTYDMDFSGKLNANQGSTNAGKVMQVGDDGALSPQKIEASGTYYGTCATAAGTQQKVVTLVGEGPSELKEGMVFIIKFTAAHSYDGKPTLKIGDFAAVTVNNGYRYMWSANSTIGFVYTNSLFEAQIDGAASTTYYGVTKLTSATNSTSEALAATAKGVKTAYDQAILTMTGATSSTSGAAGRVPAPVAGDVGKFLKGNGTWDIPEGSRLWVVDLDAVSNTSGSYSHTTTVSGMTEDLKAVAVECGDPTIFHAPVSIVSGSGSVTLTCSDVAGSSTVKASFLVIGNANPLDSSEYAALDTRIGSLSNLNTADRTNIVSAVNSNAQAIMNINSALRPTYAGWITNANLNDYTTTGQYMIGADPTNSPSGWGILTVTANRPDTILQQLEANLKMFIRECRSNVWSSWQELVTKNDISPIEITITRSKTPTRADVLQCFKSGYVCTLAFNNVSYGESFNTDTAIATLYAIRPQSLTRFVLHDANKNPHLCYIDIYGNIKINGYTSGALLYGSVTFIATT